MIRDISTIRSANQKVQSSNFKVQREKSSNLKVQREKSSMLKGQSSKLKGIKKRHPLRDAA